MLTQISEFKITAVAAGSFSNMKRKNNLLDVNIRRAELLRRKGKK